MSKELYIAAHEELIEQYLLDYPHATDAEAYDKTADGAYDRYRDKYADMVDNAKQRAKDRGEWPPKQQNPVTAAIAEGRAPTLEEVAAVIKGDSK